MTNVDKASFKFKPVATLKLYLSGEGDQVLWRFATGSAAALLIKIGGAGLLFLMHIMAARSLGAQNYGIFTYARDVGQLLAVTLAIGLPTAVMRFVAQYAKKQEFGLLRGIVVRSHQLVLGNVVFGSIFVSMVGFSGYLDQNLSTSLICASILTPMFAFARLYEGGFRGLNAVLPSQLPQKVLLPGFAILGFLLLPLADLLVFLPFYLGVFFVLCLGSSLLFWRRIANTRTARPQYQTRFWLITALPIAIGGISQIVLKRTDVFMLGAMTDMTTVGIYAAATRIATLTVITISALNTLAAPMLSAAFHSGEHDRVRRIMLLTVTLSTGAALPAFAVVMLFPEAILGLLGTEYSEGVTLLRILTVGQLAVGLTGASGVALTMTGRGKVYAIHLLVLALLNAVGNFVVIPTYGAHGAAVVTSLSLALLAWGQLFMCRDLFKDREANPKETLSADYRFDGPT